MLSTSEKEIFKDKFNKELRRIVIPIAIQNLISAMVASADVILLGRISQEAMAAISLAGQIQFVLLLFYFGISTGSGILTAQYWGKQDVHAIQRVLNIAVMFSVVISAVFFVASFFAPEALMRFYTKDPELIEYGKVYVKIMAFSVVFMSLSQMYLSLLKSMEKAKQSTWISSSSLIMNVILDAICVFILFPDEPIKAITGVAIATVFSRAFELMWCIWHSHRMKIIRFHLPYRDGMEKLLRRDFVRYTLPVQANYIVWGGALTVTATIIGHVSSDLVAANSITSVIRNLAIVLCNGIAAGGSVLIGKYLGQKDIELAKMAGNQINRYALAFGFFAGVLMLFLKPVVLRFTELNDTTMGYLDAMFYISAVYCIGKSMNSTNIGGIFPAGGDSKFGFLCDTVVMWGIVLPVAFVSAFVFHVSPVWIYFLISLDEFIKLPLAIIRYRQYKWLKNITREFA